MHILKDLSCFKEFFKESFFGPLEVFRVKPYAYQAKDPNVKSSRVEIWISKDHGRVPARMKAKVPIAGSVKAILTNYSVPK